MRPALIDLDEVVANCHGSLNIVRVKENLPPFEDPQVYGYIDRAPFEQDWIGRQWHSGKFIAHQIPIRGALPAARILAKYYSLFYPTSRPFTPEVVGATNVWADKYELPDWDEHIFFMNRTEKGDWARSYFPGGVAFAVDDSPTSIRSYVKNGIPAYVVKYSYNQDVWNIPGVTAVDTLWDVFEIRVLLDRLELVAG